MLVMIHHMSGAGSIPHLYISSFHMPFFFWLSGLLYSPNRYPVFSDYAKRKCRVLLKPLLLFTLLNLALTCLFHIDYYTIDKLLMLHFPNAMWFVFVLLLTELVFYFIAKGGRTITTIAVIAAFSASALLYDRNIVAPLNICSTTIALGFYGLGFVMKDFAMNFFSASRKWVPAVCILGMGLPLIGITLYATSCDLSSNYFPHPEFLYASIAIGVSLSLIRLSAYIPKGYLHNLLTFVGRNSITALCLHVFFIHLLGAYLTIPSHLTYKIIECVFVIGMSTLASYIVSRWGKWMIR